VWQVEWTGGGEEEDEPCIPGEALLEDDAQRDGTGATGREFRETAVGALDDEYKVSECSNFHRSFSYVSNLER